jgi:hypothetical protein
VERLATGADYAAGTTISQTDCRYHCDRISLSGSFHPRY